MWQLAVSPLELIARAAIVYVAFLAALRLFGKREVGQFTLFDLALVLLAANALQPAMTGPDASLPGAFIIIGTIFSLNRAVAEVRRRVPSARWLFEGPATIIARDGHWLPAALDSQGLDDEDLEAALREHGLDSVADVKLAALEQDGSISIVPVDGSPGRIQARRRRYRRHSQG